MGKGNRSRTQHATEIISSSTNKKTDNTKKTNGIIWLVTILVALLLLVSIGLSVVNSNGLLSRGKKAITSKNYKITGTMLSYFVYSYYNSYYAAYASYLGIETGVALEDQAYESGSDITWFDYFAYSMSSQLKQTVAFCEAAKDLGISLDAADKKDIDDAMAALDEAAAKYGYTTNGYVQALFGTGVNTKDVRSAMEMSSLASKVQDKVRADFETEVKGDEAAIKKYFDDNPAAFLKADTLQYTFTATLVTADATVSSDETEKYNKDKEDMKAAAEKLQAAATSADAFKAGVADYICGDIASNLFDEKYNAAIAELDDDKKPSSEDLTAIKAAVIAYCKDKMTSSAIAAPDYSDKVYSSAIASVCTDMVKTLVTDTYEALDKDKIQYVSPSDTEATDLNKWLFDSARKDNEATVITAEGTASSTYTVVFTKKAAYADTEITKNAAHILIQANGDTIAYDSDDSTNYASAAAKKKAEDLLDQFNNGEKTLDAFKKLSEGNTADSGCEYDNIKKGDMVTEFEDWVFDAARTAGETGIVKTDYGYHIMYFIGDGEEAWKVDAISDLVNNKMTDWFDAQYEKFNITVNDKVIVPVRSRKIRYESKSD